jgi:iron complex outermembrane receptor protein
MLSSRIYHESMVIYTLLTILMAAHHVTGQTDSVHHLQEIEVTAQRINFTEIGKHTDHIDSQMIAARHHDNLASVLSAHTPLFVRSYGAGTLSTLGIRGGGAAHTQILWNGIPLRNPMVGILDLALLPGSFIDEASIHYGGHGAAFGSGAVGGLISVLNHPLRREDGFFVELSGGSWGKRAADIRMVYGLDQVRLSTRFFSLDAENNYRYRLIKGFPEKNQVHNHIRNRGILQEIFIPYNEDQSFVARLWYQSANRQIPPTSTQTISQSAQQDESLRATVQWNFKRDKAQWQIKTAWLDEIIDYQDTMILLYTHNRFKTWLAEAESSLAITSDVQFTGGVYTEISQGQSENYSDVMNRHQTAVYSSVRLITGPWVWRMQAREERTEGEWSPLLIDFSSEWNITRGLSMKASVSRNYRAPTLNDLHWRPGGNPELTSENGWTLEGGIHYAGSTGDISLNASATAYTRKILDWIMWMPPVKDVNNFWSPINIAQVHSKGMETRVHVDWSAGHWKARFRTGLDLTWSTFEESLPDFRIEAGEQLFYVPVENLMAGVHISDKKWSIFYDHRWFGHSTGINDSLPSSHIGTGGISCLFAVRKLTASLYIQAENVWNTPYRIIERRPMPGRGFTLGIKFSMP